MKWVENEVLRSNTNNDLKKIGDFLRYILVDRVTWYVLLVGGDRFSMKLISRGAHKLVRTPRLPKKGSINILYDEFIASTKFCLGKC